MRLPFHGMHHSAELHPFPRLASPGTRTSHHNFQPHTGATPKSEVFICVGHERCSQIGLRLFQPGVFLFFATGSQVLLLLYGYR